jgi:hypothetical protein
MGLIREPKKVDFTFLDKPWTEEEKKEFSAFIKLRKLQQKKSQLILKKLFPKLYILLH